jgi:hypothetical protein
MRVPPAGIVDKIIQKKTTERTLTVRLIGVIVPFTLGIYIVSPIFIDDAGKNGTLMTNNPA